MHDSAVRRSLNEYLACEFGLGESHSTVKLSESQPFELVQVHKFAVRVTHNAPLAA